MENETEEDFTNMLTAMSLTETGETTKRYLGIINSTKEALLRAGSKTTRSAME